MSIKNLEKYSYLAIPIVIIYNYFFYTLIDYIIACQYNCSVNEYDKKCEYEYITCYENYRKKKMYTLLIISIISLILGIVLNSQDKTGFQYIGTSIIFSAIFMMLFTILMNWTIIDTLLQIVILGLSLTIVIGVVYMYYDK